MLVFSFIAWSGTGKTTYIEHLVTELKFRGLRVAVIKHDAHSFEVDKEGKDSWRFAKAGADVVVVSDKDKYAIMEYRSASLDSILSKITGVDIVIVEGWHSDAKNPILIHRAATNKLPKIDPQSCIAVVSDEPLESGNTPLFPLDNPIPLIDFLLSYS